MAGRKIFVAGATGLAGSAIVRGLLESAKNLHIRASWNQTEPFLHDDHVDYVRGDLSSLQDCQRMISGCDSVIMAAARTGGAGELSTRPWLQINQNLAMNATLLQVAAEQEVRRLVMVSTASLYQPFEGFIREEQLDLNADPPNAYMGIGWVARYVEKLCSFWRNHSRMAIGIIRASNIFGPYSRFNKLTSNFIPALIRKATDGMDPYEVWGSPSVTRDVVYVDDFARAVITLFEREDIPWCILNIGSGVRTTVDDVVKWALKAANHFPRAIRYIENGPTTAQFRALDCSKAREMIGWAPQFSVEEGITATSKWWKENRNTWTK
ncbi:MAG: NAD(P)-dependent oxidoreductase [Spirochaetia bacterium]